MTGPRQLEHGADRTTVQLDRGLIYFVCSSSDHNAGGEPGLTKHKGQWAICPRFAATDHEWVETGGLAVPDAVARWFSLIDAVAPPWPAA